MIDIDSTLTFIFLTLPLVFAFICLYYSFYYLKNLRSIEDIPPSKVRSATQGFVELNGISRSLTKVPPLTGKLTGQPCAWYYYKIEWFYTTQISDQETRSQWNIIEQGLSIDPFLLDDGTGECIILPQNGELIPNSISVWRGHTRVPTPQTQSFWHWLLWDNWGRYRYTEQRLMLETPIYARGTFSTLDAKAALIQTNPLLRAYCEENNLSKLHVLSREGLDKNEYFRVSATPLSIQVRQFTLVSFMFFIAFIFFATLAVHSSYPVVKKALLSWHLNASHH